MQVGDLSVAAGQTGTMLGPPLPMGALLLDITISTNLTNALLVAIVRTHGQATPQFSDQSIMGQPYGTAAAIPLRAAITNLPCYHYVPIGGTHLGLIIQNVGASTGDTTVIVGYMPPSLEAMPRDRNP